LLGAYHTLYTYGGPKISENGFHIATLDSHIGVLLWEENYEEAQHKRRNYERFYLLTMEMLVT
jgi:hypothetical protein